MKSNAMSVLGKAAIAAAVFLDQALRADDLFAEAEAASKIKGGPVMASPHGLEEYPWLTRSVAQFTFNLGFPAVPEAIKNNRALANNPRVREEYPALTRVEQPAKIGESAQLRKVRQNAALANSPRMREDFPELQRESSPKNNANSLNAAAVK
jgi:hypothetical protein